MSKRKVSPEEKAEGVGAYLRGELGLSGAVEKYGVSKQCFLAWVRNYQIFGREGLQTKHRWKRYSTELQTAAVKDYLSGTGSQTDICKKYGVFGPPDGASGGGRCGDYGKQWVCFHCTAMLLYSRRLALLQFQS